MGPGPNPNFGASALMEKGLDCNSLQTAIRRVTSFTRTKQRNEDGLETVFSRDDATGQQKSEGGQHRRRREITDIPNVTNLL